MKLASRCVTVAVLLLAPSLAHPGGKCGDAVSLNGKVWVTWSIPVPRGAVVTPLMDDSVFKAVDAVAGTAIPVDYPAEYNAGLVPAELGSDLVKQTSLPNLKEWERLHGVPKLTSDAEAAFKEYFRTRHVYSTLVQHPTVDDPDKYAL